MDEKKADNKTGDRTEEKVKEVRPENPKIKDTAIDRKIDSVIALVHENHPDADLDMILKAYNLAKSAHGDQYRLSGEPYIIHPVSVAYILAQYKMDAETVTAALLHDVVEDTPYTREDIEKMFNPEIAAMVDGVTKIGRLKYQTKEENQAENFRKMVLATSEDIRIVIIKLVDRLHNMRTLDYMKESKQIEKSRESLDIYAPIANRLGIQSIKAELEDLSLKYLEPDAYYDLVKKVKLKKKGREEFVNRIIAIINRELEKAGIKAKVYGRSKHFYSIYRKMTSQGRDFDDIYDLFAIRIITESVQDCYSALGIIHTLWNPIPGRFKDYIATPKANNYQSIHTTVIGPNGDPFEIQIRTKEMHEIAEYGVAAHWRYKEGKTEGKGKEKRFEDKIAWIRQMLEWKDDADNAGEFLDMMKTDMLNEEVYVFTPNGEIVELPAGSCPIDFAYRIHSDIGNTCVGAKVNGKIVPLNYVLNTGDIVAIRTSKASRGPSRDWLSFVKSAHSKNKIRQYFKKAEKEENVAKGRTMLETELKRDSLPETLMADKILQETALKLSYKNDSDMFAAVGYGGIKLSTVIQKMHLLYPKMFPVEEEKLTLSKPKASKSSDSSVFVAGQGDIDVRFAKCCSPVPGDPIVGYITVGKGISVHRQDCPNITAVTDPDRLVEVEWNKNKINESFPAQINIQTTETKGGLITTSKIFYDLGIPIISMNTRTADGFDYYRVKCEIKSVRELNLLMKNIQKLSNVVSVYRS
ncbi:MAG: RelA/SpoT family protein [Eubacteriaceae bacterium]|jgi:guanosine-3',5'-bis(diphosphate) 3'-pyrophosphohydrolase